MDYLAENTLFFGKMDRNIKKGTFQSLTTEIVVEKVFYKD